MSRARLTGFSAALVTVAASLVVPAVLASASSAATSQLDPRGPVTLTSHKIDVTTSTGRHLQLQMNATHGDVSIALVNTGGSGWHEQHAWSFNVLPAMRYDKVEGKGWVRASKSQLHRYGVIDLTVRQTEDWSPVSCDQGTAATAPVHIKGTLRFNTHNSSGLHPWGQVGSAGDPMTIDVHGKVVADHGCGQNDAGPSTFPCIAGTVWTQRLLFGESFTFRGQDFSDISTFDFHVLPHTQTDGVRLDALDVTVPKPMVTQTPEGVVVNVTTPASSQRVTGSATISAAGSGQQQSEPCGSGTNAMTDTSWTKATLTNSPEALTVHPDLGKAIVAHEGGGATVDQITVGPAPSPSPSPSPSTSPSESPSPSATVTPAP